MLGLIYNELIKIFHKKKTYLVFFSLLLMLVPTYLEYSAGRRFYNPPPVALTEADVNIIYSEMQYQIQNNPEYAEEYMALEKKYGEAIDSTAFIEDLNKLDEKYVKILEAEKQQLLKDIKKPGYRKEALTNYYTQEIKSNSYEDMPPGQRPPINEPVLKMLQMRLDRLDAPQQDMEFNALNFIQKYLENVGFVLLMISVLFAVDMVSSEANPETQKILLINPVNRWKILLSKLLAHCLVISLFFLLVTGISFLAIGLMKGFGDPSRPVFFNMASLPRHPNGNENISAEILPFGQALIQLFLKQWIFLLGMMGLCLLISSVVKSSLMGFSLGTLLYLGTLFAYQSSTFSFLNTPLNFLWMAFRKVIMNQEVAWATPNEGPVPFVLYFLVPIISSIFFSALAFLIYGKRDIKH